MDCQHKIAQIDINGQSESLEVLSSELELRSDGKHDRVQIRVILIVVVHNNYYARSSCYLQVWQRSTLDRGGHQNGGLWVF